MKKNSGEIFDTIQVDPITGQYFIVVPEQIINELSWYEDTEVKIRLEGEEIVICERCD
jgi:antitoxin component of MazEF toxin-antitoxin module